MNELGNRKPKIAAVLTRALDAADGGFMGQLRIMASIQDGLAQRFRITRLRLLSAVEGPRRARALFIVAIRFLLHLLSLRPIPLQCALFDLPDQSRRLATLVEESAPEAVYLDSIRSFNLVLELRRRNPALRIVLDLTDLMSRRMRALLERRQPLAVGYLGAYLPKLVIVVIQSRFLAGVLLRYERLALRRVERLACETADAIVLLSKREADELTSMAGPSCRAEIIALPPPSRVVRRTVPRQSPIRFCFVGSDRLLQNRETLDVLLRLWREAHPTAELHIAGDQQRTYRATANVVWLGLIPDLASIYDEHAVLLCPSFVEGGIKTKVGEAFGYGIPVVGNRLSFEGLEIEHYPLLVETEDRLKEIVCNPDSWRDEFDQAAVIGQAFVAKNRSFDMYARRWQAVIAPQLRSSLVPDMAPDH